ncbi:hypothetical protein PALA111701_18180 [Paenibacillus lactis]|uniref:Uncharacterized protein n=1 Tax=Paenibacillus lactis TaxID=228574 RepID=A0ABS4FIM8_9BACL|nr:hypothetical protein [Paenibacillus lactis]
MSYNQELTLRDKEMDLSPSRQHAEPGPEYIAARDHL